MNLDLANCKLKSDEDFYMEIDSNNLTKYAAVIKRGSDDYVIEVALKSGYTRTYDPLFNFPTIISNKKELTKIKAKGINFNKKVEEEISKENLQIVYGFEDNEYLFSCPSEDLNIKRHEELVSGVSIYNPYIHNKNGTAGAFFKIQDDTDDSVYVISNFHVMAKVGNPILNSKILQPSLFYAEQLGLTPKEKNIAELYWMNKDDRMDAAIAKIDLQTVKVRNKSYSIDEKIKLKGICEPMIGDKVRKCGSRTGTTSSVIRSTNCTVNISNSTHKKDIYRNQILTSCCMALPGDSGSVLVNENDYVVGLLFARNKNKATYANNILSIFNSDITEFNNQPLPKINFKEFL